MSDLDRRLHEAAAELRQSVKLMSPPPINTPRATARRPWLVFAASFAAVIIVIGAIPLLGGIRDGDPVGPLPPTGPLETPTEPQVEEPPPEPPLACSAEGMGTPPPVEGLPPAVSETRRSIAEAASRCDYAALADLGGPDLVTSFGGGGVDNLELWEEQGEAPLALMVTLLHTGHGVVRTADGMVIYAWPAAHAYDSWDEVPDAAVEELLTIHSEEDLDRFAEFGSYAGWRLGISETGQWLFFVAGD